MRRDQWLWLGILAMLALVIGLGIGRVPASAAMPSLTVSVIDVGQGDAILIEFPNRETMLVDAGPRDAGPTVVQYLKSRRIAKLSYLVATHPHEDHIGGMLAILNAFPVETVWDSGYNHGSRTQAAFYAAIKEKGIRFGKPREGFSRAIGDATVEVLAPGTTLLTGTNSDANNNSLVLRISYGQTSVLLTGDMETEARETVRRWPASTVLKVAHHGSHNGTDAAFLRAVAPRIAVISVASRNSYGHPHRETLQALQAARCQVLSTASDGTLRFTLDGTKATVERLGASRATQSTASPSASASSTPAETGQRTYIGNRNSQIFHRASCGSLPAEQNRVYFSSRDDAINQGYRPCKKCQP